MNTKIKYILLGIAVSFIALVVVVNVFDDPLTRILVLGALNLCATVICTGIIVHHVEKRKPFTADENNEVDDISDE